MLDLSGIIPAILTPFTEQGDIDEAALRHEVRYMLDTAKVQGLTVTGTTGEGYALDADEVRRVTAITVDEAHGQVPVVTGVIADSLAQALKYVEAVRGLPVVALQVTPVHYLFDPGDDGHVDYFRTIGEAAQLPVIIYNVVPWANLSVPLLKRLVTEVSWVQGVKQSGGTLHKVADLLTTIAHHARVFTAIDDLLYPSFSLGAHGTISAIATLAPGLCVELWNAVQQNDQTAALSLHERLLVVWRSVEAPDMPARIKTAVNLQGRTGGFARKPFRVPPPATVELIQRALKAARLI